MLTDRAGRVVLPSARFSCVRPESRPRAGVLPFGPRSEPMRKEVDAEGHIRRLTADVMLALVEYNPRNLGG